MIESFEERLGYRFSDRRTLTEALTHSSYANECGGSRCSERLEFLGDAVLEMVVSEAIFNARPDHDEGSLTNERSLIVRESSLARWASHISLAREIFLSRGMEIQGGRESASILADAMEAVIGAIFLDGGIDAAKTLILRLMREVPPQDEAADLRAHGSSDAKSRLQEILQANGERPPIYEVVSRSGPDHASTFVVSLTANGGALTSLGTGRSKKAAEFAAAKSAIEQLERRARGDR